jgi:hypothetical protein
VSDPGQQINKTSSCLDLYVHTCYINTGLSLYKSGCERGVYLCHFVWISDYHCTELSRANKLLEYKLRSRSRTSELSLVSLYCVYSVIVDDILICL